MSIQKGNDCVKGNKTCLRSFIFPFEKNIFRLFIRGSSHQFSRVMWKFIVYQVYKCYLKSIYRQRVKLHCVSLELNRKQSWNAFLICVFCYSSESLHPFVTLSDNPVLKSFLSHFKSLNRRLKSENKPEGNLVIKAGFTLPRTVPNASLRQRWIACLFCLNPKKIFWVVKSSYTPSFYCTTGSIPNTQSILSFSLQKPG